MRGFRIIPAIQKNFRHSTLSQRPFTTSTATATDKHAYNEWLRMYKNNPILLNFAERMIDAKSLMAFLLPQPITPYLHLTKCMIF
jgi:hypothetical protein